MEATADLLRQRMNWWLAGTNGVGHAIYPR